MKNLKGLSFLVMLNLVQSRIKFGKTLKQVQGDITDYGKNSVFSKTFG